MGTAAGRPLRGAVHRQGRGAPHRRTLRSDLGRPVRSVALRRERAGAAGGRGGERALRARRSPFARAASPGHACEARLARPGMRVGLGGLAKGWALDAAARRCGRSGTRTSSSRRAATSTPRGRGAGRPGASECEIRGAARSTSFAQVDVRDRAFSTSGDYEHAYVVNGRRYHHLIDSDLPPRDRVAVGDGPRAAGRRRGDPREGALHPRRRARRCRRRGAGGPRRSSSTPTAR